MIKIMNSEIFEETEKDASKYGSSEFWNKRYQQNTDENFDWYLSYDNLKPYIEQLFSELDNNIEILIPGCGNSDLGARLHEDGYQNITNIDNSPIVIESMEKKYSHMTSMQFVTHNALQLDDIPDGCFDVIIDKGLLDSQMCTEDNLENVSSLISEMYRVLVSGGIYIVISHGVPDSRICYLASEDFQWSLKHIEIGKENASVDNQMNVKYNSLAKPVYKNFDDMGASEFFHVYVCTKDI